MAPLRQDYLGLTWSKVPIVKALLPYVLGIVLSKCFFIPWFAFSIFLSCWVSLLIAFITMVSFTRIIPYRRSVAGGLFFMMILMLGYWLSIKNNPDMAEDFLSEIDGQQYIGTVVDDPVYRQKSIRFPLRVQSAHVAQNAYRASGTVMVTIARDSQYVQDIKYGDVLAIKNKLKLIPPSYNPKEFDYGAYLKNKDILYQCYLNENDYTWLREGEGNWIIAKSLILRSFLVEKFSRYLHHDEAYQIAIALIFGYRSAVDTATLNAFTNTGTIHVLSVSGLHVSLVFGFLTLILGWIDRFRHGRFVRCLIVFVMVWCYVILTGMAPPILRAGIMISFFLISIAFGKRQIALNTLCASAFFILLFSPKSLFDVGFQLSYMAMLGIILLYPLLRKLYLPTNKYLGWCIEYSYVSIAAQLFTLPLVLYYFGQFPNYFLIANLFIALPSIGVMYTGLVLAICPFSLISTYLGYLLDFLLMFMMQGLKWIEHLPFAVVQGISWPYILVLLGLVLLVVLVHALNYRAKKSFLSSMTLLLIIICMMSYQYFERQNFTGVKIYNMRKGIAIAYIGQGETVLYATYDTIMHPDLSYSVLPDLSYYSKLKDVKFISLKTDNATNGILRMGKTNIAILEKDVCADEWYDIDIVLWRNNTKIVSENVVKHIRQGALILFDGSNADRVIEKNNGYLQQIGWNSYVLKNNFAYVWNGD